MNPVSFAAEDPQRAGSYGKLHSCETFTNSAWHQSLARTSAALGALSQLFGRPGWRHACCKSCRLGGGAWLPQPGVGRVFRRQRPINTVRRESCKLCITHRETTVSCLSPGFLMTSGFGVGHCPLPVPKLLATSPCLGNSARQGSKLYVSRKGLMARFSHRTRSVSLPFQAAKAICEAGGRFSLHSILLKQM